MRSAGGCFGDWGKRLSPYHRRAPQGVSRCIVCGRIVIRGMGRWWESTSWRWTHAR